MIYVTEIRGPRSRWLPLRIYRSRRAVMVGLRLMRDRNPHLRLRARSYVANGEVIA